MRVPFLELAPAMREIRPELAPGCETCWRLFVVRVPERDALLETLDAPS